ncbi:hypothetical protein [Paractinoplanes globisporus]|uniref:CYTH domain-containing protein n=1 Tax=Paractinoplanes globisporus TaxID=113565 RepID=A0ABW6WPI1_9ACTN|nr:hypothetical protein [Actinoplanes globisporus]
MQATGFWQSDPLRTLAGQAERVELKLVVPEHNGRSLGIKPHRGPARRVYFLDTPDLALYRHGVIVRFRDRPDRRDDVVVKLRPVVPGRVPSWLRQSDRFQMEIDALPGHAVCSGALKKRLARREISRALVASRPLTGLLSAGQRKLLARYAPAQFDLSTLVVYGPIEVRCHTIKIRGLNRGLTAERWRYPNGADLLELSTRCPVDEAAAVAARFTTALKAYGVTPSPQQHTKTEIALVRAIPRGAAASTGRSR